MKLNINKKLFTRLSGALVIAASLTLTFIASAKDDDDNKANTYVQTNLVSDLPGVAQLQDPLLTNAWGISFGPGTPFWVSDNGTGVATLYQVTNDPAGNPVVTNVPLVVNIPGDGFPTGQLFNPTTNFHGDLFIFAGEDGFISGWHPPGTNAQILVARSNAVYKGITLVTNVGNLGSPLLVAANFREGTVDVYDDNFNLVQLMDTNAPAGFAPFNVANIDGHIFVTFAKQNDEKHDDVAGPGNGLIDVLNLETGRFHRFATGSAAGGHLKEINSPWGLALAPESFGKHEDQLLVGNFGSGTIMTFEADGKFGGFLDDTHHKPIVIDGLWALTFGNGTKAGNPGELFFSAGPNSESDGLFGRITPTPQKDKDKDDGKGKDNDKEDKD